MVGDPTPAAAVKLASGDPLARTPFLLLEEHGAELAEPFGTVDEHGEDLVAFANLEREHPSGPVSLQPGRLAQGEAAGSPGA